MSQTLQDIWVTRSSEDRMKSYYSMGVISDGSLGTLKGIMNQNRLISYEYFYNSILLNNI